MALLANSFRINSMFIGIWELGARSVPFERDAADVIESVLHRKLFSVISITREKLPDKTLLFIAF